MSIKSTYKGIKHTPCYGVVLMHHNVFGLGEEAELTAQKMKVAQMFNTPQQLHSSTSAAFLPNPCYGLPCQDNALGGLCKTHNLYESKSSWTHLRVVKF